LRGWIEQSTILSRAATAATAEAAKRMAKIMKMAATMTTKNSQGLVIMNPTRLKYPHVRLNHLDHLHGTSH